MTAFSDPDLTAALEEIQERAKEYAARPGGTFPVAANQDLARLLAAVVEVLKDADDWEKEAARLDALAQSTADLQSRVATSMRAQAFEECARKLRKAITRELTGKEPGHA